MILSRQEVESAIRTLLKKYNADHAILFGSYARGEELREMTKMPVDAYEICEVNVGSPLYNNIMREGGRIA